MFKRQRELLPSVKRMTTTAPNTGQLLGNVLGDLERLVTSTALSDLTKPTPCPEFSVADLRQHILGWLTFFAAAVSDPDGATERPDPTSYRAPDAASAGGATVADAAGKFRTALAAGAADRDIKLTQAAMPGSAALQLILWEYLVHGWDLAVATGQEWNPPAEAATGSLAFAKQMLTPQWRGKDFGQPVEVPADAPPLAQVLGFTGRDPEWVSRG